MKRFFPMVVLLVAAFGCNTLNDVEEVGAYECDIYCNMMEENCDLVYSGNRERCLNDCDQYRFNPQVDSEGNVIPYGERVDDDDSFECRIYHLETALDGPENNSHCEEASPSGGGTCVTPGVLPQCALICHGATYGCNLTLEDYQNCEEDCETATTIERDSADYRCRATVASRAQQSKNEGTTDPDRPVCGVVRDVFIRGDDCVDTALEAAIPGVGML